MGLHRRSIHETNTSEEEGTSEVFKASRTSRYKKLGILTAAVGAFLVLPLAVYGMSASNSDGQDSHQSDSDKKEEGNVQSSTTDQSDADHQGATDTSNGSSSTPSQTNSSSVDVTVNGQSIPVPQNGSVKKVIKDEHGQTSIDISVQSQQSTSGSSHSSTQYDYDSDSNSDDSNHNGLGGGGGAREPRRP